ncbi:MAG: glycosyltransferase [Acetobacteraceae bacterium]|nr:glycosyltransferase [Acetobacteraceae bacterium]
MPTVSYVVTLFDKAPFLPYLCAGLAAQEGPFEREYIFVDDGSRDSTADRLATIVAGWPRTTVLRQANAGPAVALNRGLAAATGEFVKPVDGDDVLLPWGTRRLLDALTATGVEMATALYPEQPRYQPEGDPDTLLALTPPPDAGAASGAVLWDLLPASLRRCQTQPSLWLLRRQAALACGGCDEGVFAQDYSLELRLAARGKVARVPGPVVLIAGRAPGRVSENEAQMLHDGNRTVCRFLRQHPSLPPSLRRLALRRTAGRAWLWESRRNGQGVLSRSFALRIAAALGRLQPDEATEMALCAPFRATQPIRVPPG